jgi:hypothetical protein
MLLKGGGLDCWQRGEGYGQILRNVQTYAWFCLGVWIDFFFDRDGVIGPHIIILQAGPRLERGLRISDFCFSCKSQSGKLNHGRKIVRKRLFSVSIASLYPNSL